ncbi:DUF2512 family protein [Bacillus licheniformis]|nr:DUF2512 family protein [Bacillus licheniformis]
MTLFLGVISYLVGDLLLLPRTNNTTATMGDFGLSLVLIWVILAMQIIPVWYACCSFNRVSDRRHSVRIFFHRYMEANVLNETETETGNRESLVHCSIKANHQRSFIRLPL